MISPLSTSKTRVFLKPSSDESYVFTQVSRNVENICRTLRTEGVTGKKITLFLKTQTFTYEMCEFQMPPVMPKQKDITDHIRKHFRSLFHKGVVYRATGITVSQPSTNRFPYKLGLPLLGVVT